MIHRSRLAIDGGPPERPGACPVRVMSPGAFFYGEEEIGAVTEVLRRGVLYRHWGEEVRRFEEELSAYLGGGHVVALNAGTSALVAALAALGIGGGDEVVIPAYSFVGIASAVLLLGAQPVFCDIDETLTASVPAVSAVLSQRTRAIIAAHMRGAPCELRGLTALCRERGIALVEDASQSFGATFFDRSLGTWGDIGCYSFQFFKVVTCGEGGALLTRNRMLFERALQFHDAATPWARPDIEPMPGLPAHLNLRMGEIEGALMRAQLAKAPTILRALREQKNDLLKRLKGPPPGTQLRPLHDGAVDAAISLILQLDDALPGQRIAAALLAEGINAGLLHVPGTKAPDRHFCQGWGRILGRQRLAGEEGRDVTRRLLERSLEIQIDPRWTATDQRQVAAAVHKVFAHLAG